MVSYSPEPMYEIETDADMFPEQCHAWVFGGFCFKPNSETVLVPFYRRCGRNTIVQRRYCWQHEDRRLGDIKNGIDE
jgi:hypothetical protein